MAKQELYFSVDIEADGPIPGLYSMLSIGAAAFSAKGEMLNDTFSSNLELLPGACCHPDTMAWWQQPEQAEAWAACRENSRSPHEVMAEFADWVKKLCRQHQTVPVFVAWPASFDFMFVYWYLVKFLNDEGRDLFSFSALDIKSYAMAVLKTTFKSVQHSMPEECRGLLRNRHVALDDATDQGQLLCMLMNISRA